jgi:hypothetical protein
VPAAPPPCPSLTPRRLLLPCSIPSAGRPTPAPATAPAPLPLLRSDFAARMHSMPQQLRMRRDYAANLARHTRFWTTLALYDLIRVGGARGGEMGGETGGQRLPQLGSVGAARSRDRSAWRARPQPLKPLSLDRTCSSAPLAPACRPAGDRPPGGGGALHDGGEPGGGPHGDGEGEAGAGAAATALTCDCGCRTLPVLVAPLSHDATSRMPCGPSSFPPPTGRLVCAHGGHLLRAPGRGLLPPAPAD